MPATMTRSRPQSSDDSALLRDVLARHCHPQWGSAYWLGRQERLGYSVCERVRCLDDLWRLGPTPLDDLRRYPVRAFVPRDLHGQWPRFITGETAGTSGGPCATAYRADEFQAAFIEPFLHVAAATGFPRAETWLWIGPSGPHIIGKVVRELARQMDSIDPFSVDFDPRWAKRLADGSLTRRRYLDHVISQALDVFRREEVGVLFTTPPALAALAERLSDRQREAIHGVHYGGLSMTPQLLNDFRAAFPNAVHLSGYGNTLFGVVMEVADRPRQALDYYPLGDRLVFRIVDGPETEASTPDRWPPRETPHGRPGRVLFHRLDASCLLVNVIERDQAERVAPSAEALALGCRVDGLRNPQPPAAAAGQLKLGLY